MGVIVGTAGHIDHGKSTLVRYLTGTDPDRLKEEKERGITIELGYVFMPLPDGGTLAFIDVPGHERFVRQMVAGVATVDCFLLVVSADEGAMPQTREHLDVLDLLDVTSGIVVLTKCDLVGEDMTELVEADVREYLSGTRFSEAPVFRVSAETGQGMEELRTALVDMAGRTRQKNAGDRFRLDVDRVFVLRGFGTIVAGTAISGTVSVGDRLQIQPGGGVHRVREMSVNHRRNVESGSAGDRIALNLVGLESEDVERGSCVGEPGYLSPKESIDTECTMLQDTKPLQRNQRVRLHTGTAEVMARAVPVATDLIPAGSTGFVHFQLEKPVVAIPGDRFVIRRYSPIVTIGGGTILETGTRKVRKKFADSRSAHLELLSVGDLASLAEEMLSESGVDCFPLEELHSRSGASEDDVREALEELREKGLVEFMRDGSHSMIVSRSMVDTARKRVLDAVVERHRERPISPGVPVSLPGRLLPEHRSWFVRAVLNGLEEDGALERRGDRLALPDHPLEIPPRYRDSIEAVLGAVDSSGLEGMALSGLDDPGLAESMLELGLLVELAPGQLASMRQVEDVYRRARETFEDDGFGLADLRDMIGASRKIALLWAEMLDMLGKTVRRDDRRYFQDSS